MNTNNLFKKDIDTILLFNTKESRRETNIENILGTNLEFIFLILKKGKKPTALVPGFEKDNLKANVIKKALEPDFYSQLRKELKGSKKIGINNSFISVRELSKLKKELKGTRFVDISKELIKARMNKTEQEIKITKEVCRLTDRILQQIVDDFYFRNEKDIELFIMKKAAEYGCKLSFRPIVANAKNAAIPHYSDNNSKLKKGFLLIDMGLKKDGMCSDITRTFYIGNPSMQEIKDYEHLLSVQKDFIKKAMPKTGCNKLAKEIKEELGPLITHSLGHGLGTDVHEQPSFSEKLKQKLKPSMIITIEPGIYRQGKYGIRIEDDILITEKGNEVLTKFTKNLIILNYR